MQKWEDADSWEAALGEDPESWICHTFQWRDSLEASFPHIKCVPLLMKSDSVRITQIPLYRISSLMTGTKYVSVPFSSYSSILCDAPEHVTALTGYFDELRTAGGEKITFEFHSNRTHELFENSGLFRASRNYLHHFIDLNQDIAAIHDSFHYSCVKKPLKRSEKTGLVLTRASRASHVNDFYRLYCLTRQRHGLPPMPLRFLRSLFDNFFARGAMEIYFAEHKGQKVGGLLILKYKDMMLSEFGGDDFIHRSLYPNVFLYWNCIRIAHQAGLKKFSFGRTHQANDGLLGFKRHWGTQEERIVQYIYPKTDAPDRAKESSLAYRLVRRVSPRMPMPLFKLMGKVAYRYLG
jgi:hypothetical protein